MSINNQPVLIVSPNNLGDGSDYVLEEIAWACSKRFEKIEVIFLKQLNGKGWKNLPENVSVHCLNSKTYTDGIFRLLFFLWRNFSHQQFYLTISSNIHINASLGIARSLKILKTNYLVARESTMIFERFGFRKRLNYKLRYKIGYQFVDKIICQTKGMKNSLDQNIGSLKQKTIVIYNPLNIEKIELGAAQTIEKINEFKPYILFVGRLIQVKQVAMLIDAYQLLPNKKMNLLIVGDGIEKDKLHQQINHLNLAENIFLYGYVANPYPFMKEASICILTSKVEGFPNSLLQMLALNDCCISTNNCDVLQDIPSLKLVQNQTAEALSHAMTEMMNEIVFTDEQLKAKRFFLQKLNPENFLNALLHSF